MFLKNTCFIFLALFFTTLSGVGQATEEFKQTVEFQKGLNCEAVVINDGHDDQPWLVEISLPDGRKAALRLPAQSGEPAEMRAASFISPDKRELFISFSEIRNGEFSTCYVIDLYDGEAFIIFDSDWLASNLAAAGEFLDGFHIKPGFPTLFGSYTFFVKDPNRIDDYVNAGIYDRQSGQLLNGPRETVDVYLTESVLDGPNESGLFNLKLTFAVPGAANFDLLGRYTCLLGYQDEKWSLLSDPQFAPEPGVEFKRIQGDVSVLDVRPTVSAAGLEMVLPPPASPLARVKKISSAGELETLAAKHGVSIVGEFDDKAEDNLLFLPQKTPLTIEIVPAEYVGGDVSAGETAAAHTLKSGEAFVFSVNRV